MMLPSQRTAKRMRRVVADADAVVLTAAAAVAVVVVEAGGVAFEHAVPNVHLADSSVNTVYRSLTHKTSGLTRTISCRVIAAQTSNVVIFFV